MSQEWKLWFHLALPNPPAALTHLWESPNLPNTQFYRKQLGTDPHVAQYRLETLSPLFKSPLMDYWAMTYYLDNHREEQMRYTVRVYPGPAAVEKVEGDGAVPVNFGKLKFKNKKKGVEKESEAGAEKAKSPRVYPTTFRPISFKKDKSAAGSTSSKGKGKEVIKPQPKGVFGTPVLVKIITKPTKPPPTIQSPALQMKGRQELGASVNILSLPKLPTKTVWVYSEDEDDADGDTDDACSWPFSASDSEGIAVGPSSAGDKPKPAEQANHKPLFDQSQLSALERIIAEATKSVPAGKEEDDLHQRLLSLLETIKPPSAEGAKADGRMCAKPFQPPVGAEVVQVFRCDVGMEVGSNGAQDPVQEEPAELVIREEKVDVVSEPIPTPSTHPSPDSLPLAPVLPHPQAVLSDESNLITEPASTPACFASTGLRPYGAGAILSIDRHLDPTSEEDPSPIVLRFEEVREDEIRAHIFGYWGVDWSDADRTELWLCAKENGKCSCEANKHFSGWTPAEQAQLSGNWHFKLIKKEPGPGPSSVAPTTAAGAAVKTESPEDAQAAAASSETEATGKYGLASSDVLVSTCPSPVLPPQPETPIIDITPSCSASSVSSGVLSPKSQKSLKCLYIADLLASPYNTAASTRVLSILEEEEVSLDSSLGLKMLDLAKSLRTDGGLGKVEIKTPEAVDKPDKAESMLRKVLEKLNDHSGMLNAIAEASGVNLLDDDEAETREEAPEAVDPAIQAASLVDPPVVPAEQSTAKAAEVTADIMATIAGITASLTSVTPSIPPPSSEHQSPAPPTPSATRLAKIAASLGNAPALFSPERASTQARPLPSVEDYTSDNDDSDTSARSHVGTAGDRGRSRSRSPSPRRSGVPRNAFADPPQFGHSYTPTRPVGSAANSAARERPAVTGRSTDAFARYAANTPASPSAAAAAAARAAGASTAQAGSRQAFFDHVDSYASPPVPSLFQPSHPSQQAHGERRLFENYQPRQSGGMSYWANNHHHPYNTGMFGYAPPPPQHPFGFGAHSTGGSGMFGRHHHGSQSAWGLRDDGRGRGDEGFDDRLQGFGARGSDASSHFGWER